MPSKGIIRSGKSLLYILAVTSGVLIAAGLPGYGLFPVSLVALVPLFASLDGKTLRQSVLLGLVWGYTVALLYDMWAMKSSMQYVHAVSAGGVAIYLVLSTYHALWCGLFGAAYHYLTQRRKQSLAVFALVTASLWVALEWVYARALPSVPWIVLLPYTQTNNIALLQWTSIGGMWIVTFIVVGFNAVVYSAAVRKNVKLALASVAVLICVHAAGYAMYLSAEAPGRATLKAALLQENVDAESRWNDAYVNTLARHLLDLNREAVKLRPDVIIWTETAIPWTFRTDDDLVKEALKITYTTGAPHIVGMLTEADTRGNVYNSVYYIEADGKVTGRYDKQELLGFLEKPLVSWQLPFRQSRYSNIVEGNRPNVIVTDRARLGVMICNETLSPQAAQRAVAGGADVLLAESNDSWFYGSMLIDAHLALTRLRAVETRRDIIVNANRGYCGIIRASGSMEIESPTDTPRCVSVEAGRNEALTLATAYPNALAYLGMAIACVHAFGTLIHKSSSHLITIH